MSLYFSVALIFLSVFLAKVTSSPASGEIVVLSSPDSLQWFSGTTLPVGMLNDLISAALGLTVKEASWRGLRVVSPFDMPTNLLVMVVEGLPAHILHDPEDETFTLPQIKLSCSDRGGLFATLRHTVYVLQDRLRRLPGSSNVVRISIEDQIRQRRRKFKTVLSKILTGNENHYGHEKYHRELEMIRDLKKEIETGLMKDSAIVHCRSLHAMIDELGPRNSTVLLAAKELWQELLELVGASAAAHEGSSLTLLVSHVLPHAIYNKLAPFEDFTFLANSKRRVRAATHPPPNFAQLIRARNEDSMRKRNERNASSDTDVDKDEGEKAKDEKDTSDTSADSSESETEFPDPLQEQKPGIIGNEGEDNDTSAIFNIILWLGTGLGFALLSIVHAFMAMDPGRDSVVYRMTEPRRGQKTL